MKKIFTFFIPVFLTAALAKTSNAQTFCDSTGGNIAIFSNYDGGILRINVDMNIPNLKIGIVSYENDSIIFSGPYVSNITQVVYACYYVSSNHNCPTEPPTKTINGAPAGTDTIIFYPPATYQNANGWPAILCNYSCDTHSDQGGCNTADQVSDYFFNVFGSTAFLFHRTQYSCWTGTQNLSDGGNCCAIAGGPPPIASFESTDSTLCSNDCIGFNDNSTNSPISWQWSFPGGMPSSSSDQNPPYICYTAPGTYDVKLVVSNSGGTDSLTMTNFISVVASPPVPVITQSHDTLYCTQDPSYTSYQWYKDSNAIAGATRSTYILTQDGNYNIKVTNENGCSVASGAIVLTSISYFKTDGLNFSTSPNPAGSKLFVISHSLFDKGTLTIYDLLGKVRIQSEIANPKSEIDLSMLSPGIYFAAFKNGKGSWLARFVKE